MVICPNCKCEFESKNRWKTKFCSKECSFDYQKLNPYGIAKIKGKLSRGNNNRSKKAIECYWDDNGCLISTSKSKDFNGYPMIMRDNKQWRLSRWIFYLNNNYLPNIVMHTCDNPSCINPSHLFPGDTKSNSIDMVKKGRSPKGLNQFTGGTKLNKEKVKEIKELIPKIALQKIADKYNVSKKLILLIKQGKRWKD